MAKVFISEYPELAQDTLGRPMLVGKNRTSGQLDQTPVNIGGASVQSSAFADDTNVIRVHTDAICSIKIGPNPTATADSARLAAGQTEFFHVKPGWKIAVITNS